MNRETPHVDGLSCPLCFHLLSVPFAQEQVRLILSQLDKLISHWRDRLGLHCDDLYIFEQCR